MMRLPARLAAKLAKVRTAQIFNRARAGSLVLCVDPAEILHPGSDEPVSHGKMQGLLKNPAPVIWVGSSEPLRHAGIGHFVRAIAHSGHFVFLETNGALLRRRIHEFEPLPQVFLTVRLDSLEVPRFPLASEGLRFARLSGFFTVIHSLVNQDSEPRQITALGRFIAENEVDGWLISAASKKEAVRRKAEEARSSISSSFWRQFSEHVEEALLSQTRGQEPPGVLASAPPSLEAEAHEETHQQGVGIA
ncbi:MAG TPA: hypothetical protein VNB49_03475 [Candidatus Dormibacteraeota bacterium]|nr:hypothetical protein [Candidatus Dormibacteraeota bacterium]